VVNIGGSAGENHYAAVRRISSTAKKCIERGKYLWKRSG